uniref:Uncharacterized protein n=1 Tax=Meloidogyne enterolobii TaxID=390850 RepID=A0A6V7XVC5_MELEN|nr:unnamed protein product [Meloidogyne enterolobii]
MLILFWLHWKEKLIFSLLMSLTEHATGLDKGNSGEDTQEQKEHRVFEVLARQISHLVEGELGNAKICEDLTPPRLGKNVREQYYKLFYAYMAFDVNPTTNPENTRRKIKVHVNGKSNIVQDMQKLRDHLNKLVFRTLLDTLTTRKNEVEEICKPEQGGQGQHEYEGQGSQHVGKGQKKNKKKKQNKRRN